MNNRLKEFWSNRWVKFSIVCIIYVLWFVVWTRNLWWLLGVIFIYDYFISGYMDRWIFSRYRAFRNSKLWIKKVMEWVEAMLFAVVVVVPLKLYFFGLYMIPTPSMENTLLVGDYLFVNKLVYGPRMPNTPLAFPFVQHTMPFSDRVPSFVDWINYPYKRLSGFSQIKRDDVVVFNFPAGDTVALIEPNTTYYELVRVMGRQALEEQSEIVYRPVDKRENYIKRCVGMPGDSLQIISGQVYINGTSQPLIPGVEFIYFVEVKSGYRFSEIYLNKLGVDIQYVAFDKGVYQMPLTHDAVVSLEANPNVERVVRGVSHNVSESIFPHDPSKYAWTEDNYGPIWIPNQGATVALSVANLPLYERIIKNYEGHDLRVDAATSQIFIDDIAVDSYTFEMNYYFMMGDNRHNSADSRFWGFVPEDHIEGKATFVWLSITPGKSIFNGLRWDRMFRSIN